MTELRRKFDLNDGGNLKWWCPDADSNHGHRDFQSLALPTELSGRAHVTVSSNLKFPFFLVNLILASF